MKDGTRGPLEIHRLVGEIAGEWDALADRQRAAPFLRPGWFSLWWDAFGTAEPRIACLRREGDLAAVLPLVRKGRSLTSMANEHTPGFDLLAEDPAATLELAAAVLALRPGRVTLEYLEAGQTGLTAISKSAADAGYRTVLRDWERPPYVAFDGDWESYEQRLDGKLRRDLGRRRRRLEELGSVSIDVEDGAVQLDRLLEAGFALEPSGWKDARGTAVLSRPETREFYVGLARWGVERGMLRLSFLRVEGRPLAFQLGLEDGGVYYFLKGGYDPEYRRFAPARLLVQSLLQRGFESGLARFEFLGPAEPFKLEWTSTCRDLKRLELFAPSPTSTAAWAAVAYGRPAATRVRAAVRRRLSSREQG
jgi:CelD/BcsL family acetyltransferase involved in cellulose biosynthesis